MTCPKCGKISELSCDNDCGTFICPEHKDYHETDDGKYKMGHANRCGNFKKMEKYIQKKQDKINEELASDKYKC